jgi:exodeoxyribonuclease VII large subunit
MNDTTPSTTNHPIFTVSELNQMVRGLLETNFHQVWIEGEISNFTIPNSGHWYFSLKDKTAQVRCAMFRNHNRALKFTPEGGMHVVVRAKVSLYEGRGDFQLIAEHIEEIGFGALQRAFEQLKEKLQKEGLFAEAHKKPLPAFPKKLGVITSSTGAAIHDILSVLKRRFPGLPVIIYPTLVQGEKAANQIVNAIQLANQRAECDVLLLARGGGSLEDLWPFNEEIVARAIFASKIPLLTGVGHEVDFTIADFISDHRAPTPSAAAELISPNQQELLQHIQKLQQYLQQQIHKVFENKKTFLNNILRHLRHCHPAQQLQEKFQHLDRLEQNLISTQKRIIELRQTKLQTLARALNAISPLATLQRGYAVITNSKNNIIQKNTEVKIGEKITAQLAQGKLHCIVKETS